jgi:hypothetical protein
MNLSEDIHLILISQKISQRRRKKITCVDDIGLIFFVSHL